MVRKNEGSYTIEVPHSKVSVGEVVSMLRELKGWTQVDLAKTSGIAPTNISQIENGYLSIGKQRAIALAKAFGVHPATILFANYPLKKAA